MESHGRVQTAVASGSGLWRFDGSSWQHIGAEWNVPDQPVAHVGFDRDGILWVLTGIRAPQTPTQLHFLAPGERRFRKVADNLFVLGFTRDADGNVLTTRERSRSEPGSSVEMEGPMPAYPILRKESAQIVDRANAIWVISKDSVFFRRAATESLEEAISKVSSGNSEVHSDQSGARREPGRSRRQRVVGCPRCRSPIFP